MAQAFPASPVAGSDYHAGRSSWPASGPPRPASPTGSTFEVGQRADLRRAPATTWSTTFDCLHDMGDPLGAARHVREALAAGRHLDDRRAGRRRHRRGQPQPGRPASTTASRRSSACPTRCPSPAATRSAPRPARRRSARSSPTPASPGSAGPRRPRSTSSTRPVRSRSERGPGHRIPGARDRPGGGSAHACRGTVEVRHRRARRRPHRLRGVRRRRADRRASSRSTRSSSRAPGRRRCPTCPAAPAWSRSTRAATAGPTGRPTRPPTATPQYVADTIAVMDELGVEPRRAGRASARRAWTALLAAAEHPDRVRGRGRDRPVAAVRRRRRCRTGRTQYARRRGARHRRGLGQGHQPALLAAATAAASMEFFFGEMLPPSRTRRSMIEDCVGWALQSDAARS